MDKFGIFGEINFEDLSENSIVDLEFDLKTKIEFDRVRNIVSLISSVNSKERKSDTVEEFNFTKFKYTFKNNKYYMSEDNIILNKNINEYPYSLKIYNLKKYPDHNIQNILEDRKMCKQKNLKHISTFLMYNLIKILLIDSICLEKGCQTKYSLVIRLNNIVQDFENNIYILTKTIEKIIKIVQNTEVIYKYSTINKMLNDYNDIINKSKSIFINDYNNIENNKYMCVKKKGVNCKLFVHFTGIWLIFNHTTNRIIKKLPNKDSYLFNFIFNGQLLDSNENSKYTYEVFEQITDCNDCNKFEDYIINRNKYIDLLSKYLSRSSNILKLEICKYENYSSSNFDSEKSMITISLKDKSNHLYINKKKIFSDLRIYLLYKKKTLQYESTFYSYEGEFIGTEMNPFEKNKNLNIGNFDLNYDNFIIEFKVITKNDLCILIPVTFRFDKIKPSVKEVWNFIVNSRK